MEEHSRRVFAISDRVKHFHSTKTPFRIYHGSTNSTRPTVRSKSTSVDVSGLNNIVSISRTPSSTSNATDSPSASTSSSALSKPMASNHGVIATATVEPNVPMDALLAATLARNLLPPVVPEFPGITVGGAHAGSAGESSSFKFGFLDATVLEVEIVLADGSIVRASREENPELFRGTAGTLGTLGVITLLVVGLVEPKGQWVEVVYHQITSFEDAVGKVQEEIKDERGNDFVDGILFSKTSGAVVTGRLVSAPPTPVKGQKKPKTARFTRRHDQWFYIHAKKHISAKSSTPYTFYTPITDYLFRYDRGGFWVGSLAFEYFHLPFDRVTRYLFDTNLRTRRMYHALHSSGLMGKYVVQDVAVPMPLGGEFLDWVDAWGRRGQQKGQLVEDGEESEKNMAVKQSKSKTKGIYPIWLCPLLFTPLGLSHKNLSPTSHKYLLNIGIWGIGPSEPNSFIAQNRALESHLSRIGGCKWLYAQTFYTEEEFWGVYDKVDYVALREKYGAEYLPDAYEKVKKGENWRGRRGRNGKEKKGVLDWWVFPGLVGLVRSKMGREYILKEA